MASKAEIEIVLSNGQQAGKTINELTAQSVKLSREIKKMEIGSKEYVTATEDYQKVAGRLKNVKTEVFNTQKAQGMLNSEMGQFIPFNSQIGKMLGTFQGLGGAIKGATLSQRALNIAIAASGIGLLVIILAKLIQAFLDTQAGMDKVTAVTRPLMAIFERLKGLVQELGGSVFKGLGQILNGNIKEGLATLGTGLTDAVKGFGSAVKEGAKVGTTIDQLTKKIESAEINMIKRQAELAREYKLQSEIAENVAASEEDRRKAATRAMEVADEEIKLQQDLIDMKIEKMKLEQSLNDTSREQSKELAELEAQRINFETQASERRTTARGKLNTVNASIASQGKAAHAEEMKQHEDKMKALEAEQAAKAKFIEESIAAELKANETRKSQDAAMLAGVKEQRQKDFDDRLTSLVTMNDAEQRMINELFFTNQITQEERDLMLYESQKKALEDRLALYIANGQQTSDVYQQMYMQLLQLNHDFESKQTATTQAEEAKRKQLRDAGLQTAAGIFAGFVQLLVADGKARQKNLAVIKAAQSAEVAINLATELQNIWKNANAFPVPFNTIIGIAQSALAVGRAGAAVNKINSVQTSGGEAFADGGVVKGPSHRNGGIKFSVGNRVNEMEGGEIILTKGVYQDPVLRSLASELNARGGGRRFEMGGPVSSGIRGGSTGGSSSAIPNNSSALVDMKKSEMLLEIIAEASVATANKPVLSTSRIRDEIQVLNEVEQDATF